MSPCLSWKCSLGQEHPLEPTQGDLADAAECSWEIFPARFPLLRGRGWFTILTSNPDVVFINIQTGLAPYGFISPSLVSAWKIPSLAGNNSELGQGDTQSHPNGWAQTLRLHQGSTQQWAGQVGSPSQTPKLFPVPPPSSAWAPQPPKSGFHALPLPSPTQIHISRCSPCKIYPPGREEKKG